MRSVVGKVNNILFIMCDQLRADHLSCAGHPHLKKLWARVGRATVNNAVKEMFPGIAR